VILGRVIPCATSLLWLLHLPQRLKVIPFMGFAGILPAFPRKPIRGEYFMSARSIAAAILICLAALCLHLVLPMTACAQAWLPQQGEGQVTLSYQNIHVRYHRNYLGKKTDQGPIRTHTSFVSFEYGLTNKLAIDADVAHVTSRFEGFVGPVLHGPADTGDYHPTFQDARIALRYNVHNGTVALTPFIGVVLPTHGYETGGHSAAGRRLRELQMGVNVGRDLEGILPRSYIHGRYSYAVVEGVEEFNLNRSNAEGEVGYFATRRLSLRFLAGLQRTHGGLEVPKDNHHPHYHHIHDRATRSNFVRMGGGGTFSITRSLDLHADYIRTVAGNNTHAPRGIALGISWRFSRGFTPGQFFAQNSPARFSGAGQGMNWR
jgi:hypothetical protein